MCQETNTAPTSPSAHTGDDHLLRDDCARCQQTNLHVRVLNASDGTTPLAGIEVTVSGKGMKLTDPNGWAKWRPIAANTYRIRARKNLHSPDPAENAAVAVPHGSTTEIELQIQPVNLHLHVDSDRDGTVDNDWRHNTPWTPGAGRHGAIVFFNNDNDDRDAAKERDFENPTVDTASDLPDLAPLHVRRHPAGVALPANVTAELRVSDANKLRIVTPVTAAGTEVVGPAHASHTLDNATLGGSADIAFAMEALQYPHSAFNGKLTVTLDIQVNGTSARTETAEVRVAPWIMFNHSNQTEKVYVVNTGDNASLRSRINWVLTTRASLPALQEATGATYNGDRWMQDGMEPGFAAMPRAGAASWTTPSTLRTALDRGAPSPPDPRTTEIDSYPKRELLDRDYGFLEAVAPTTAANSLDSFGNLECSPPFTHSGAHGQPARNYPFGRVVFGDDTKGHGAPSRRMHARVRALLAAQVVQDPFPIDTNWLVVGHVDEFVCFLPGAGGSHGWKVVIASPRLALDIVRAQPNSTPLFHGINMNRRNPFDTAHRLRDSYPLRTCGAIKGAGGASFRTWQTEAQAIIDAVRNDELKVKLDLQDSDFIHLPVLFQKNGSRFIAYTAGSVNMLVITKGADLHLCVPKPFGPRRSAGCRFRADIRTKLSPHARTVRFIDDFLTYHVGQGEIHCGTNSQRTPPSDHWWEMTWI